MLGLFFILFLKLTSVGSLLLAADWVFDPEKISSEKSLWKDTVGRYEGEYYYIIYYKTDNQKKLEIFRILERFMPDFNCSFN